MASLSNQHLNDHAGYFPAPEEAPTGTRDLIVRPVDYPKVPLAHGCNAGVTRSKQEAYRAPMPYDQFLDQRYVTL